MRKAQLVCVGGGAASFFFAANVGKACPNVDIQILEQGPGVLGKVRISGGGRCNVTHHCFDPEELIENYPRGKKELLGPFYTFGPTETVHWFESRGVKLKTEEDGRMFPTTDSSETIIACLTDECQKANVQVRTRSKVKNIKHADSGYDVEMLNGDSIRADILFVAPGGSKQMWQVLEHLGHAIVSPVPSLFTFQIRDERIRGLAGVSVPDVTVTTRDQGISTSGPLLITHRGLSGPSILKMSAFGARILADHDYKFQVMIDWIPDIGHSEIRSWREIFGKKLLGSHHMSGLPKRLYQKLTHVDRLDPSKKMASVSNKDLDLLTSALKKCEMEVIGQNRFKEEFVTAGGVDLSEVDMSTFGSKVLKDVYMAGEVLNIDAVTGGFNFQAAWTGAFIAARAVIAKFQSK